MVSLPLLSYAASLSPVRIPLNVETWSLWLVESFVSVIILTQIARLVLVPDTARLIMDFIRRNIMTGAAPSAHWLQIHWVSLALNFCVSSRLLPITPPVLGSLLTNQSFLFWGPLQPLLLLRQTRP